MNRGKIILMGLFILISFISCRDEDKHISPKITIEENEYVTKPNRDLIIQPKVENVDSHTAYAWMLDGKVIGTTPKLIFRRSEPGTFFLKFKAITKDDQVQTEIKVEVKSLIPPKISFKEKKDEYIIEAGETYTFKPIIQNKEGLKINWIIGDQIVSTSEEYKFKSDKLGAHFIEVSSQNEDGKDDAIIKVYVVKSYPINLSFKFKEQSASLGRTIKLSPYVQSTNGITFQWFVNGKEDKTQTGQDYLFTPNAIGKSEIKVVAHKNNTTEERTLVVHTVAPEQTQREINANSKATQNKVYDFLPAPGQFVNEGYTATTMQEAIAYAENNLKQNNYVSLGAFGGYIVVGFDHSIVNSGDYDFGILGNSFKGSSEPGIVWVMQDENGNGLPDDNWYELKGSETGKPSTIQNYSVTYYRNSIPRSNIMWIDNKGNRGEVEWLGYHQQPSYYPDWVKEDSYTLTGTRLQSQTKDISNNGSYWVNPEFEWGYVDNFSPIDRLTNDNNSNANANANYFKISNAITFDGKPIHLKYIDFIKVQTGLNTKAGHLGENSTEVLGFFDKHIKQ